MACRPRPQWLMPCFDRLRSAMDSPTGHDPHRGPTPRRPWWGALPDLSLAWAAELALLAATYVVLGYLGLHRSAVYGFASLFWAPTGLCLAVLLWRGVRLWPGVAVGALLTNLTSGAPLVAAVGVAAGNTLEAVLGFLFLTRRVDFHSGLDRVKDVLGLLAAALLSSLLSAAIGVLSLVLAGPVPAEGAGTALAVWWTGDVVSVLVVTPLVLSWAMHHKRRPARRELVGWSLATVVGLLVFSGMIRPTLAPEIPRAYLVFPIVIWAAIRSGLRATTTASATIAVIAAVATLFGRGPFASESPDLASFLGLQIFILVLAVTTLMLNAALAERNARDELVAIAAHELRNPLHSLNLQHRVLVERAGAYGRRELDTLVAALGRSIAQVTQLATNLLDVARFTAREVHLEVEELDLKDVVEEVARRLPPSAQQRIEMDLEPVSGNWDRSRMDQVVTNLLSNAVKYGRDRTVTVTLERSDGHARLGVADEGPGIARADTRRIFDAYVRLDGEGPVAGTGLGLTVTERIVRAHGGRIFVHSKLGEGSRFVVELPRSRRA